MLTLAGVTINSVISEDGILHQTLTGTQEQEDVIEETLDTKNSIIDELNNLLGVDINI